MLSHKPYVTSILLSSILTFACLSQTSLVSANETAPVTAVDCAVLKASTQQETEIAILKDLLAASLRFMEATCQAWNEDDVRAITDRNYLTNGNPNGARSELISVLLAHFNDGSIAGMPQYIEQWRNVDYQKPLTTGTYSLKAIENRGDDIYTFLLPSGASRLDVSVGEDISDEYCETISNQDCELLFDELERVTTVQNKFFATLELDTAIANTAIKIDNWERFSENARFMTFVDILATSWVYRDEFSDGNNLPNPPEYQIFALRPSIVYESFSAAMPGEQEEFALAIEWAGFNKWDAPIPFGVSLASVYSDRSVGKKLGHGLMLHINNSLSIGFANRGSGDNSVYVNIDLLEWFGAKQDLYQSFKSN